MRFAENEMNATNKIKGYFSTKYPKPNKFNCEGTFEVFFNLFIKF